MVCDSLDAQEESLYLSNRQETYAAIGMIFLPVWRCPIDAWGKCILWFWPLARFQTQSIPWFHVSYCNMWYKVFVKLHQWSLFDQFQHSMQLADECFVTWRIKDVVAYSCNQICDCAGNPSIFCDYGRTWTPDHYWVRPWAAIFCKFLEKNIETPHCVPHDLKGWTLQLLLTLWLLSFL